MDVDLYRNSGAPHTPPPPLSGNSRELPPPVRDAKANLTRAEWQAVSAAFLDASAHTCGGSKPLGLHSIYRKVVRALTGIQTPPPLANPRLEKLRYFVCFARDNGRPSQRTWAELIGLGYSEAQVEAFAWLALEGQRR